MSDFAVEMRHVTKAYPGVLALDNVNFNVKKGEIMALLGENGAGKSTLMKVLSGECQRDSGEIRVFGNVVKENLSPTVARGLGIAIIHQEISLCPHLTVAENIFLGREKENTGLLATGEMNNEAQALLDRLNIDISPTCITSTLPISKQQMVEIAKAISVDARILIMDEPTSALTDSEIEKLFSIIRSMRDEGRSIIYISHRMDELRHIVDRLTIMRDGKFVLESKFSDITMEDIIANMVGREIKEKFPHVEVSQGKVLLRVNNLNAGKMVKNISFELHEGEILGIAGLMGAGRTEMTRALFGIDLKESGEVFLEGKSISINKPLDSIKHGIVLVPEDRKKDGISTRLSVRDNISLPNLEDLCSKLGVINKQKEKNIISKVAAELSIKMPNMMVDAANLSGGNQQKVVVAKWLVRKSKVILFDEPTRGIDVAAKVEIYNLMNQLKQQGIGVLFVSSEMPEILGMADRILVMCDGQITGQLDRSEATQEKVLEYAMRFESKL